MTRDLILPDARGDDAEFRRAVRMLRDHLLGAVDVDRAIGFNGRAYIISWGDRQPAASPEAEFWMTSGMRVMEGRGGARTEVVRTGEEQVTLVVDGERLVFHLVAVEDDPTGPLRKLP
jgi:hypothetical protein